MTESAKKRRRVIFIVISGFILIGGLLLLAWTYYLPVYLKFFKPPHNPKFALELPDAAEITYMARVNDGYYRGSDPQKNLAALKNLGIRTIVNLHLTQDYHDLAQSSGFNYHWIPMRPDEEPSIEQVKKFLAIATDPAALPVYVHCSMGIDRTGVMSGIYRVEHDGWPTTQAVEEMNYFGHAKVWHDLGEYLENYRKGMAGTATPPGSKQ